jgi:LPXTG-motif cell wall-anchored protein
LPRSGSTGFAAGGARIASQRASEYSRLIMRRERRHENPWMRLAGVSFGTGIGFTYEGLTHHEHNFTLVGLIALVLSLPAGVLAWRRRTKNIDHDQP